MASKNTMTKAVTVAMTPEMMEELQDLYPTEQGTQRIMLPRLGFVSQDKTEETKVNGKKQINIVTEAGTFFLEEPTENDETDEDGKPTGYKAWSHDEIGTELDAVILFQRKQLKHYDSSTEIYTSSPIYDTDDEVVPLFSNKTQVDRGTPAELKKKYEEVKDGKTISTLEDHRILYVLYAEKVYQINLRGSSMYSFKTYARKTLVPSVVTTFSSESREKGSINWNMITFTAKRPLGKAEAEDVIAKVRDIKETIAAEKAQYATGGTTVSTEEYAEAKEKADKAF